MSHATIGIFESFGRAGERPEILEVRERVLTALKWPVLTLGFFAAILGAIQTFQQGRFLFSATYLGIYVAVMTGFLLGRRVPFAVRAGVLIAGLYMISVAVLVRIGLSGIGLEIMILSCVLAAVFLGVKIALIIIGLSLLVIVLTAWGMISTAFPIHPEHMLTSLSPLAWATSGVFFAMMSVGLVFIPQMFLNRLKESLSLLEERSWNLAQSNLALQKEVEARKKAEKGVRESEEKYRNLVESVNSIILRMDVEGKITFFNEFAQRFFGYELEEILGRNVVGTIVPETESTGRDLRAMIEGVCRDPDNYISEENENIRRNGSRVWIAWTNKPLRDETGAVAEILSVGNDVTDRRLAEDEKAQLETRLKRAEKMEAVGALAGGVAHDLNNILSGIVSYPDLLLLQLPEESPLRKPIKTIQESGQKAAAIVQDLLTLARRGVPKTEVVNLNHIISDYLISPEHLKLKAFHRDVEVRTHLGTGLLNILGSPLHLSKTIMNLVSNAAEAMPEGGVILIATHSRYVDRPVRGYDDIREGDYAVVSVSDTGTGISSEDREKIFEPFYTKKEMGRSGTGLGLAVVWGTVKDHKGYIDIESSRGKGTTFTLYFPVTREKSVREESLLSVDEYRGKGEKILVVDDMENQREIASMILSQLGYSPSAVSSGEEAVEYVRKNRVDLIILDMIMDPGMDGLDAYRKIVEIRPGQKAIIASGFSETERVKEAQRLGAGRYIRKPYTLEKIGLAVKKELNR